MFIGWPISKSRLQIFPTAVRARGLNFASVGSAVASMIVNEIWPIGLAKLHSKVYFIFMAVNIVWIPVCNFENSSYFLVYLTMSTCTGSFRVLSGNQGQGA